MALESVCMMVKCKTSIGIKSNFLRFLLLLVFAFTFLMYFLKL